MNDRVRHILDDYLNRPPAQTVQEATLRAYQDWAVSQIYIRVLDHPFEDPADVIFEFAVEMSRYLEMFDPNSMFFDRFHVYYDTAIDIGMQIEGPRED